MYILWLLFWEKKEHGQYHYGIKGSGFYVSAKFDLWKDNSNTIFFFSLNASDLFECL